VVFHRFSTGKPKYSHLTLALNPMMHYWLVTAQEDDFTHMRICSSHEKACLQAWRWQDDDLDDIKMEEVTCSASQDDIPF
jgi:hypothetical protein